MYVCMYVCKRGGRTIYVSVKNVSFHVRTLLQVDRTRSKKESEFIYIYIPLYL
ncbi:hypothetical protein LbFV_ORF65 [Leptopilina boulardi filamentous virus]|uniref:Uncharacterized protein n=1 Tax=Leptopilina boulardi filamentous virus TaxID=552509 RepID=A0A1S5YDB5_9VIRU|nr:hypothetical protein LbFV_ORF65 [Leptopilina boulardi filamentous virus]AQQ79985.1 hypothetical protein LbFV_ORF65 [Leptopilina boulardi filamentous virus]